MSGNRTWIYCRIAHGSVLGQDAIEIQRRRLEWYAAQHGLTVVGSSEDCQPGTAMDRPGVQRMNRRLSSIRLMWCLCSVWTGCAGRLGTPFDIGIISTNMVSASAQ